MVCTALPVAASPSTLLQCVQSVAVTPRSPQRTQQLQCALQSLHVLATLHQDLLATVRSTNGDDLRFCEKYCEALSSAITGDGGSSHLASTHAISLALEGRLFDLVHKLATSMSSQDHVAVLPVLRSLVRSVRNGAFDNVAPSENSFTLQKPFDGPLLDQMIKVCRGSIPTKDMLLGHLQYYLRFLYAVSPTEGQVFGEVSRLVHELETRVGDDFNDANGMENQVSEPVPITMESLPATDMACILCKYSVAGHIHPTPNGQTADEKIMSKAFTSAPVPATKLFFGVRGNPHSPIYYEMESFLNRSEGEYNNFGRADALAACHDSMLTPKFHFSDLYDAIGSAHDSPSTHRAATSSAKTSRHQLLSIINDILQDTSCLISYEQLMAIHTCLLPATSGQAGVIRTGSAVGYESSRVYRVFLPAEEVSDALQTYLHVLNDASRWTQRPLLRAYYAFSVLVFFIHPFHDGNGRSARLIGNLVAKKLGFRTVLRPADKTLQLPQFLQKSIVAMEIARASRL